MKNSLLALLLAINLSGCVGLGFSKNGSAVVSETDYSQVDFLAQSHPSKRIADKIYLDGSEMYVLKHERKWCDLTIFALIPIPL